MAKTLKKGGGLRSRRYKTTPDGGYYWANEAEHQVEYVTVSYSNKIFTVRHRKVEFRYRMDDGENELSRLILWLSTGQLAISREDAWDFVCDVIGPEMLARTIQQ